jgi:hypothetical protein
MTTTEKSPIPKKKRRKKRVQSQPETVPEEQTSRQRTPEVSARSFVILGASGALAGIALSATGSTQLATLVAVPSLVVAIWGAHLLGRLGPDTKGLDRST